MIVTPEVEAYLDSIHPESEGVFQEMEEHGKARGFPLVGPRVGRLLWLLARSAGARRIFECGSGYGYSAAWFALAAGSEGEVILTDRSAENLDLALEFLTRAGLGDRCRLHRGDALELLERTPGTFDLIFVDIDKEDYPRSLDVTVKKLDAGGLLVTDNVLWKGEVAKEAAEDETTEAVKEFNRRLFAHPELATVILPIRDGVAVSYRK